MSTPKGAGAGLAPEPLLSGWTLSFRVGHREQVTRAGRGSREERNARGRQRLSSLLALSGKAAPCQGPVMNSVYTVRIRHERSFPRYLSPYLHAFFHACQRGTRRVVSWEAGVERGWAAYGKVKKSLSLFKHLPALGTLSSKLQRGFVNHQPGEALSLPGPVPPYCEPSRAGRPEPPGEAVTAAGPGSAGPRSEGSGT